jgi:hypothetical protein
MKKWIDVIRTTSLKGRHKLKALYLVTQPVRLHLPIKRSAEVLSVSYLSFVVHRGFLRVNFVRDSMVDQEALSLLSQFSFTFGVNLLAQVCAPLLIFHPPICFLFVKRLPLV